MSPLLNVQKNYSGSRRPRSGRTRPAGQTTTNQTWWVQKWFLISKGRRAWLLCSLPRCHTDGWKIKMKMKRWRSPAPEGPAAAPLTGLFGCRPHAVCSPLVFLDVVWLLVILRQPRTHVGEAYSLSRTAIIISVDELSVPPSIRFPNYTGKRSAVANNQTNEIGYLDSIIASPPTPPCPLQHTQ